MFFSDMDGELGENIHGVGNDEDVRVFAQPRAFHTFQDLNEQRHIAVDQVQARFVGLAAQPGCDQEEITIGRACIIARIDLLVTGQCAAVQQIERFTFGGGLIGIQQLHLCHQPATLQGKSRAGTDPAPSTNNG